MGNSGKHLPDGIDVRGAGGYVRIPPTKGFKFLNDKPIAPLPERYKLEPYVASESSMPVKTDPITQARREAVREALTASGWYLTGYNRDSNNQPQELWRRPDKPEGHSASLSSSVLTVFSTNSPIPAGSYSLEKVLAMLGHPDPVKKAAISMLPDTIQPQKQKKAAPIMLPHGIEVCPYLEEEIRVLQEEVMPESPQTWLSVLLPTLGAIICKTTELEASGRRKPVLWGAVVGTSGDGKSELTNAINHGLKPLEKDIEQLAAVRYEKHAASLALDAIRKDELKEQANKEADPQKKKLLEAKAQAIIENIKAEKKRAFDSGIIVSTATAQALAQAMREFPRAPLIVQDEGRTLSTMLTSTATNNNMSSLLCQGFTGGAYKSKLKDRSKNISVDDAMVCMAIAIQPTIFSKILSEEDVDQGMYYRMSILGHMESLREYNPNREPEKAYELLAKLFRNVYEITGGHAYECCPEKPKDPMVVKLSPQAKAVYDDYLSCYDEVRLDDKLNTRYRGVIGKVYHTFSALVLINWVLSNAKLYEISMMDNLSAEIPQDVVKVAIKQHRLFFHTQIQFYDAIIKGDGKNLKTSKDAKIKDFIGDERNFRDTRRRFKMKSADLEKLIKSWDDYEIIKKGKAKVIRRK